MLRKYRLKNRLSAYDLASLTGVPSCQINNWENNRKIIKAEDVEKIAECLECLPRDLVMIDSDGEIIGNRIDPEQVATKKPRGASTFNL